MIRLAMMPIGMSRRGLRVSSAVVETASKPMNAKKTMAAPLISPAKPLGVNGCQLLAFMVNPSNWHPFTPNGFAGLMSGAAIVFFAFIGFDAVSTTAEETRNPRRDMPIGIIASLIICTVLYVPVSVVLTGINEYTVDTAD